MKASETFMEPAQEEHLHDVKRKFCVAVDEKYRKGQAEHGGNLWKKPGMFPMLLDETLDFVVYSLTMEQQLREILSLLQTYDKTAMAEGARLLDGLLNGEAE